MSRGIVLEQPEAASPGRGHRFQNLYDNWWDLLVSRSCLIVRSIHQSPGRSVQEWILWKPRLTPPFNRNQCCGKGTGTRTNQDDWQIGKNTRGVLLQSHPSWSTEINVWTVISPKGREGTRRGRSRRRRSVSLAAGARTSYVLTRSTWTVSSDDAIEQNIKMAITELRH